MWENKQIISNVSFLIKREVIFEKSDIGLKIRDLFLKLWNSCTLRGIGGEQATNFYLTKNNIFHFEFNRVTKILFINSVYYSQMLHEVFGQNITITSEVILQHYIARTIRNDLKIDIDYDYAVKNYNIEPTLPSHIKDRSEEVDISCLTKPVSHIDDVVNEIMREVFDTQ